MPGRPEYAVKSAYDDIHECLSNCEQALRDHSEGDDPGKLHFTAGMFAGLILQVGYTAIRFFSTNSVVPAKWAKLVQSKQAQFCVGNERHDIPTGLIVYAGRTQFNHWEGGEKLNDLATAVFNALTTAFRNDSLADLAFELPNPMIINYAGFILLTALGWTTYDKYLAGMKDILG